MNETNSEVMCDRKQQSSCGDSGFDVTPQKQTSELSWKRKNSLNLKRLDKNYTESTYVNESTENYNRNIASQSDYCQNPVNIIKKENSFNESKKEVEVKLLDADLWYKFHQYVNEMIVTKEGRRMFPVLKVAIQGLDPTAMYTIKLDFAISDPHRWKFMNAKWVCGNREDNVKNSSVYMHTDSPNFGSYWMESSISFSKLKISNKSSKDVSKIQILSLFRYKPRIHIYAIDSLSRKLTLVKTQCFDITEFIAVTAYQNDAITKLKVNYNPFAKAFLDSKKNESDFSNQKLHYQNRMYNPYARLSIDQEKPKTPTNNVQRSYSLLYESQNMSKNKNWDVPQKRVCKEDHLRLSCPKVDIDIPSKNENIKHTLSASNKKVSVNPPPHSFYPNHGINVSSSFYYPPPYSVPPFVYYSPKFIQNERNLQYYYVNPEQMAYYSPPPAYYNCFYNPPSHMASSKIRYSTESQDSHQNSDSNDCCD